MLPTGPPAAVGVVFGRYRDETAVGGETREVITQKRRGDSGHGSIRRLEQLGHDTVGFVHQLVVRNRLRRRRGRSANSQGKEPKGKNPTAAPHHFHPRPVWASSRGMPSRAGRRFWLFHLRHRRVKSVLIQSISVYEPRENGSTLWSEFGPCDSAVGPSQGSSPGRRFRRHGVLLSRRPAGGRFLPVVPERPVPAMRSRAGGRSRLYRTLRAHG